MTTYSKSGSFGWAGGGKGGAIVDMWAQSRFGSPPAENAAPPSGSPDGGPVTTGTAYGSPGAFTVTVTVIQDYYLRVQYGGQSYWSAVPANDLAGAPVASGVTDVTGDETSIHVVNGTTVPVVSLKAGTGDVTWSAGSTATTLVGTSNVNTVVGALANVTAKLSTATAASTYAPLNSATLTGTPSLPTGTIGVTQSPGNNGTALATTAFVQAAIPADSGWRYVGAGGQPTFQNAWGNYGSGFVGARFRKIGSVVYIEGVISGGSNGNEVFTLPAGYIPSFTLQVPGLGGGYTLGATQIGTDGTVTPHFGGSSSGVSIACSFALGS